MDYHFILTLMAPVHGGPSVATFSGTVTVREGQTRDEIYTRIFQDTMSKSGMANANVMFFDFSPNTLATV